MVSFVVFAIDDNRRNVQTCPPSDAKFTFRRAFRDAFFHAIPFRIRTSETPLPQLLYNPHLQAPLGSAGNKGLITPLESALTKNSPVSPLESALAETWGVGWGVILATPEFATRNSSLPTMFKSFLFRLLHTLLRFLAPVKNSTLLFSSNSELFAKNTRV